MQKTLECTCTPTMDCYLYCCCIHILKKKVAVVIYCPGCLTFGGCAWCHLVVVVLNFVVHAWQRAGGFAIGISTNVMATSMPSRCNCSYSNVSHHQVERV